jgi:molybdopterin synthase catalytic subunit
MFIDVRLFAMLREQAGSDSVTVEVGEGATVRDVLDAVGRQHGLGDLIERMPVVMAVNREYVDADSPLAEGDELALIPPVSGGETSTTHTRVTSEPLSLERLARMVVRPQSGAVVTFQGTTRDVERLEYEAYVDMAEERIAAIVAEAIARHGLAAAAAEHRIGIVPRGEASVAVAASAAHRGEAFAGAREIIDRIKAEAPIWKKEVDDGQEHWVKGARPHGDPGPE